MNGFELINDTNDWDGDTETEEYRFDSKVSADCDPSYLMDPVIPFSPSPSLVVYADGPHLARVRQSVDLDGGDETQIAEEYANHRRGAVALFADSSARFLNMSSRGVTRNTRLEDSDHEDADIYDIGDWEEERYDCFLGTYAYDVDDDSPMDRHDVATGPDWDTN
jgi:hypothetical protein